MYTCHVCTLVITRIELAYTRVTPPTECFDSFDSFMHFKRFMASPVIPSHFKRTQSESSKFGAGGLLIKAACDRIDLAAVAVTSAQISAART